MNEKKKKKEEVNNGRYIPDDIAFSILSKLPLKSITRFSCAHKSWSLLFENPNFVNLFISKSHPLSDHDDVCLILSQFLRFHGSNFSFLYGHKFQNKLKLNFSPYPHPSLIDIFGSVNGILCIFSIFNHRIDNSIFGIVNDSIDNTLFWNPATKEVKIIPPSLGELLPPEANAEFELYGFGYDHVRDDYNVIKHVKVENHEHFWEIYSLKSDSWRKLNFDMPTRPIEANMDVYLNGVCHWLGQADDNFNMVMASFDLANEVCFVTPLPFLEGMHYGFHDVEMQVLNGSVAVMINQKNTMSFHILILGELGVKESWVRLFDIGPLSCILHNIIAWKNDNIFFRKEDHQLACFDLTTRVIEEIGVKAEHHSCQMVIYKKNLLPFGVIEN